MILDWDPARHYWQPFAVVHQLASGRWEWVVYAPMLAGVGNHTVPWTARRFGTLPTHAEAVAAGFAAAGAVRAEYAAAERRIPRGSGPLRRPRHLRWRWGH